MATANETYVMDHMRESLAKHVIEEFPAGDRIRYFVMRRPGGGSVYRVDLIFAQPGIALMGDISVGTRNGCLSDKRYDLGWFVGELSEDYLCGKFLERVWSWESCKEELHDWLGTNCWISDARHRSEIEDMVAGKGWLYSDEPVDSREVYERLSDLDYSYVDDGVPGRDYDRGDAGWLCVIQQRFRELYWQQHGNGIETT